MATLIVLAGAACSSPTGSSHASAAGASGGGAGGAGHLSWARCNGHDGPKDDQCATLPVPLNYDRPNGRTIAIALDRKPATGTKIGSLILNPGGPGASGIDDLDYLDSLLSPTLRAQFDVLSFDPRGVGLSAPVECENGPQLDELLHLNPAPTTQAGFDQLLAASRAFDQACEAHSGALLAFVGTVNAARDLDAIRAAAGDAQLTYFGFSYGTFLGATYASLFPTHIRAMVLDGAVNPASSPITANIAQAAGFDRELTAFFDFCARNSSCAWKPAGDQRSDFSALMARIAVQPLPGIGKRTLGPGEAFFGVAQDLYNQTTWPDLANGLAQADAGNGSMLLADSDQYTERNPDGTYTNALAASNAIGCVDQPWPRDPTVLEQAASMAEQAAPDFGVADLYGALTCTGWPVLPTSQPHAITASGSPPIVVVGSTGDPATPYADAQALAGQLQRGVLLTREGNGHTGYRSSACIRTYVDAYLVSLTVPPPGVSCPTP